ncbi:MAG: AraC family transcriptional regulator [Pseudomonadales bacterium]|nr:AraC family transcriptional regulator [Pseudomonadales bacterium]
MSNRPDIYLESPDALSSLLTRLELTAEVYVNGDFCGAWAVDTSGSRRIPFHLIGRGQAWLHMEGEPERCLSPGDLVVFPHDSQHILSHSADLPIPEQVNAELQQDEGPITRLICGFFEFRSPALWPLLDALAAVIVLDLSDMSSMPSARAIIDMMVSELNQEKPGHYAVVNQLAVLLFVEVIRHQITSGQVKHGLLAALFDKHVGKALNRIHHQPEIPWTLASLANEAALGRSTFAQRFTSMVGVSAMQYLTSWRMAEATRMLQTTTLSMLSIAEKSGYESEAAFRKAYRQKTGKTPGSVRKG